MSSKSLFLCLTTCLILFSMNVFGAEATEFLVGGNKNSWRIHTSPNELNEWAEKERFRIGDSLVFKYDSKIDSVLRVDEEDYKKCNKSNPSKSYNDGNTKIKLDEAGPFFFISGANGNCEKGEKLEVKVLSQKHAGSVGGPSPSQAPKPSPKVLPRPVLTPANAPPSPAITPATAPTASTASSNAWVIGISTMVVMATLFVVAMV
ncbi:unnamed protein product [Lactuca saligna]|uniref:Phytocyanin domain-containing protein n=1 Tax=Lactuca saligna TaxID=75948 RepID=A0AA36E761_LACSI|nr:unnamed protein product [Lactuca saligna]